MNTPPSRILAAASILAVALASSPAQGQDPAVTPSVVGFGSPVAQDWAWVRVGPLGGGPMSDVALHPSEAGVYAVAAMSGEVHLTIDAGKSWISVLPSLTSSLGELSVEEEVLLQVEARLDELVEDVDLDATEEIDPEDYESDPDALLEAQQEIEAQAAELVDAAEEAARTAADEVQTELQADPWFLAQQEVLSGRLDAARPKVFFTSGVGLVVARADGLWVSSDLGATWQRRLEDLAVLDLVRVEDGWLAATPDGVRYGSADLSRWEDRDDGTEGDRFIDLAEVGGTVYAASGSGLWRAERDGRAGGPPRWLHLPRLDELVLAVLPDPDWEGGLWIATPRTVLRSDDRGDNVREPLGAPVREVRSLVHLGLDHILVSSSDAVWESIDGGTSFRPLARGLADPQTRGLAIAGATLLLASEEGLLRLEKGGREAVVVARPKDALQEALAGFAGIEVLMDAALSRPELRAGPGSRWVSTALPDLQVEWQHTDGDQLLYDPDTGSTRQLDGTWSILGRLQWTPAGRQSRSVTVNVTSDALDDITILDGSAQMVAANSVSRGATEYRNRLASLVGEMHSARAELVSAWSRVNQGSVLEQTFHALRIAEIEAQLDVLTDGAVSAWRQNPDTAGPSGG